MSKTITKKLMLFFPLCECEKPIIYHLVKDYNLLVNVYRAKVTPDEFGYLVLDVTGSEKDIKRGIDFVKTFNVTINYTGKGVIRDNNLCTHCGNCLTHCPTHALDTPDLRTREVVYNETECIECLACIRVCPYKACASAF
jgi:ferredoxin